MQSSCKTPHIYSWQTTTCSFPRLDDQLSCDERPFDIRFFACTMLCPCCHGPPPPPPHLCNHCLQSVKPSCRSLFQRSSSLVTWLDLYSSTMKALMVHYELYQQD